MKLKHIIATVFFPDRCSICGEIKPFLTSYCPRCKIDTRPIDPEACPYCAHKNCICNMDIIAPLPHFTAVYYYEGQVKRSLHKFKFYSESSYADIFGKAMADKISGLYSHISFDGICFVPMTARAEYHRGYNQSELLCLKISKELKIPVVPCLKKTADNLKQKDLTGKERLTNVRGSFAIKDKTDIKGKTLILCDDIKTTGATLKECCDTLMKAGAKDVYCISLALTPYISNMDIF